MAISQARPWPPLSRPQMYRPWLAGLAMVLVAAAAYSPFWPLSFVSDSYLQVALARAYGHPADWAALMADPLYRCRSTSLVLTWLLDAWAGPVPQVHRLANFALHLVNVALLFSLIRRLGWGTMAAGVAGAVFAVHDVHQEAVIWVAALPELLVFFFLLAALRLWLEVLEQPTWTRLAGTAALWMLALASKESAVVFLPLAAALWLWRRRRPEWSGTGTDLRVWWWLCAGAAVAGFYAVAILTTGDSHLHLTDGSFSLRAPFVRTELASVFRILMPFGWVAVALLLVGCEFGVVGASFFWMGVTLLPYAFLTYQSRVPSRHTYLASAGAALLIAAAVRLLWRSQRRWLAPALVALVMAQSLFWLWTRKAEQYRRRTASTELFLEFARPSEAPVRLTCAPYGIDVYRSAAQVVLGRPPDSVLHATERPEVHARSFCDPEHP